METRAWDESELVRRCRDGSEAGYAELIRRFRPRLYAIAYRLTNDPEAAQDVLQEAFLAAFRGMERFEPRPSLVAWLTTITVRIASRSAARQRTLARAQAPFDALRGDDDAKAPQDARATITADPAGDPHAAAVAAEFRRDLADAIARLPFKYRSAVVLRYAMGMDYAEAARALELPLNTFKSHLLRGTRMLRDVLGPQLAEASAGEPPAPRPAAPDEDERTAPESPLLRHSRVTHHQLVGVDRVTAED